MKSPSAEEHHKRMKRGVDAASKYLQSQFPNHVVEVLSPSSRDFERSTRTFTVRNDRDRYVLVVTDGVLDFDAMGVSDHLERLRVSKRLRETGSGQALLITTDGTCIEPI